MLVFAAVALILAATLTPGASAEAHVLPQLCIICNRSAAKDFLRNVLLFMPLGLGLRMAGWSWRRTLATCFALSGVVELLQFVWVPRRDAALRDLAGNSTGGVVGWLIPYVYRHVAASHRVARDEDDATVSS